MGNKSSTKVTTLSTLENILMEYGNKHCIIITIELIKIIMLYSNHKLSCKYEAKWSLKDPYKSKYLKVYDIHRQQLRLIIKNGINKDKHESKLHFNRLIHSVYKTKSRIQQCELTFFKYDQYLGKHDTLGIQGKIKIGLISNYYLKKRIKRKYLNDYMNQNYMFIGIYSEFVMKKQLCDLYFIGDEYKHYFIDNYNNQESIKRIKKIDFARTQETPKTLFTPSPTPINWRESIVIQIDTQNKKLSFEFPQRWRKDNENGKVSLSLKIPNQRYTNEDWYLCCSISLESDQFPHFGLQISDPILL